MRKVAVLTINNNGNFGNRLQNYAVQEVLKRNNIYAETINNQKGIIGTKIVVNKIKKIIKLLIPISKYQRLNKFSSFNKNINYSKIYIDENHIPTNLNELYDIFFTGSDQVWNPTFNRMSDIDFLTFADSKKRNSLSASFGIDDIPNDLKEYYKSRLIDFNFISVREERGKEIIEKLTGRKDVEVLVDPTMLLTTNEWDKVSKRPKQLNKVKKGKYILNYFLGNLSESRKQAIEKIAKTYNCHIINILDKKDPFYASGPSEFLYLEKNAFLICTDSFHSSVFAILYNRPFVIFDREQEDMSNMSSRIDTLLSKFELKDRKYNGEYITKENINHNYSTAYKILEKERKKANVFLKKALNIDK